MKIEELVASLKPEVKEEEGVIIPASDPITRPDRLIGPVNRPMSICFPRTANHLRDSMTTDLIEGIERRQAAVARSMGGTSILMYDPVSKGMQRRSIRPDGHLGGVEL